MSAATAQHSPSSNALQNRGKFLATVFFLSFFSFVTVAFGNFVILWVDPARETVEAFTIDDYSQLICFWSGLFYWGLCAWYGARLMLERSFAPFDYILPCISKSFAARIIKWTPRALGLLAVIPIALLFLFDPRMQDTWFGLRVVPLGIGALLLGFFVFRKKLFGEFVVPLPEQETGYGYRRFGSLTKRGCILVGILFGVSVTILLALLVDGVGVARWIGAPAILLFALGSWALFGGFILLYLPMSFGLPAWTPIPFLLAALFSLWNDNHNVPIGKPANPNKPVAEWKRPTLEAQWKAWRTALDSSDCKGKPIYLVAMSGGASRAALWGAYVLSSLEQQERRLATNLRREPCFARNIFAISGVSGGSLGAAAFVSALAQENLTLHRWPDLRVASHDFLRQDVLAPILGYMLFQDGVQRFLPFPLTSLDRSHGLEDAWKADWSNVAASNLPQAPDSPATPVNWFAQPMRDLYADGRNLTLPSLFLNTTRVANGRKVVQSNLNFKPEEAYDIFEPGLLTGNLSLAGAVHNSARFSYLSPAGLIWHVDESTQKKAVPWGYVVDGGYFENSGASTLAPLIRSVTRYDPVNAKRLVLIIFSNDPSDGKSDYVCPDPSEDLEPLPIGGRDTWPRFLQERNPLPSHFGIEVTAPPIALYQTRTSRAHAASVVARNAIDRDKACEARRVVELRIPMARIKGDDLPMSWFLNDRTQVDLERLVTAPADAANTPARRLCENLEAIRGWIENQRVETAANLLLTRCRQPGS
jgi:hypothetical protein